MLDVPGLLEVDLSWLGLFDVDFFLLDLTVILLNASVSGFFRVKGHEAESARNVGAHVPQDNGILHASEAFKVSLQVIYCFAHYGPY